MKTICFLNTTTFWGGGEKLHFDHALYFKTQNYKVIVACSPNSPLEKKCIAAHINTFSISFTNLSFLNIFKIVSFAIFLKKNKIDSIVISTSEDIKAGGFGSKIVKLKSIVYLRGLAVPVKNTLLNRFLFNKVITHIVANSEETKRMIVQNFNNPFFISKLKVIYHGIDLTTFNGNLPISINNPIVLGNAGRLTTQKGQKYLIEVAKLLKAKKIDFKLRIAGEGELKDELQVLIEKYQLQNEVQLLGFISDIPSFMNDIDIFLLSSEWEGFGYVIVEAMACYKPVVAFNVSSNPEIITDNQTGFLVTCYNIKEFTNKTISLIENKEQYLNFAQNARNKSVEKFNNTLQFRAFQDFIELSHN